MKVLVTGSSGLIGSAAVRHWDGLADEVVGIDNDMRQVFFGPLGSTQANLRMLLKETRNFEHLSMDICDRPAVLNLFSGRDFDLVIHCAAQPSHDKAREIAFLDFEVNAVGTLNLLEAARQHAPDAVFCHLSTNKVYGDSPNELPLEEHSTRWDFARPEDWQGITEECRIDRTTHSLFGASKLAADILAQEYGRYFGLKTGVFRGGCLTGSGHAGVELHGFLSYLVRVAVQQKAYTVFGYKGKQVRDQIDCSDVVSAFQEFYESPRPGEVYNLGGGRENSASILECMALIEELAGYRIQYTLDDTPRQGDHQCYITNLSKFRTHFPGWRMRYSLKDILSQMLDAEERRMHAGGD